MKPKRANEANFLPYFSHISTVYSRGNESDKAKLLQHADFLEGHARNLGTNLPRSMGESRKESELIGKKSIRTFPTTNDSCLISSWYPINHLKLKFA